MQKKIEKLKSEKFLNLADVVIIAVVVFAILILLLFSSVSSVENPQYNIYVENELYKTGSLNEDEIIIVQTDTGSVTFVVQGGTIHAENSTCADGLCEKQGEICTSASRIICLPNKIYVEITGGESSGIDAVS